jgi:hypothetical protein
MAGIVIVLWVLQKEMKQDERDERLDRWKYKVENSGHNKLDGSIKIFEQ